MRLGYFTMPLHPPGREWRRTLAEDREAILLAERGWSVLLLDKAAFPRPKICGEYLSPESARILDRLGVLKGVDARQGVIYTSHYDHMGMRDPRPGEPADADRIYNGALDNASGLAGTLEVAQALARARTRLLPVSQPELGVPEQAVHRGHRGLQPDDAGALLRGVSDDPRDDVRQLHPGAV